MCEKCEWCDYGKLNVHEKIKAISEVITTDYKERLNGSNTLLRIKGILEDEWKGY